MVKIYVMSTCPDCAEIKKMELDSARFQRIDIGEHVHNLKEFMRLRDSHPKFEHARKNGLVGIPSFLLEDGTVTFKPEEAGLVVKPVEIAEGTACSVDGKGC